MARIIQAHRDVKPANMIVDYEAGILKICDLGSAKKLTRNDKSVSYVSEADRRDTQQKDVRSLRRYARVTIGR